MALQTSRLIKSRPIQKNNYHPQGVVVIFLVRQMGLEPIRLRTRTSNVPVCRFQHCRASCIIRWSQKKVNTQFYRFGKFFLYNRLFLALMPYECYTLSMQRTEIVHPFPPFFRSDSHILILGSFPSVKSREQMFFYGHPQNRFWRVLAAVFEDAAPSSIPEKRIFLERNHVALWDSIGRCTIEGSSDSSIRDVVPNDLSVILNAAPIAAIFCNGRQSFDCYNRYILPSLGREALLLPSTSPANAAWSVDRLVSAWRVIREV